MTLLTNRGKALATLAVVYGQQIGHLSEADMQLLLEHADYARGLRSLQAAFDTAAVQGRGAWGYYLACANGDEELAAKLQTEDIVRRTVSRVARGHHN